MDALHREQRKEREETENKIKGLVNEVKLYVVCSYCFVSLYTSFEQIFPWIEIRANLSFALPLPLSKCPTVNEERNKGTNKRTNEGMEPKNEGKKEGKEDYQGNHFSRLSVHKKNK